MARTKGGVVNRRRHRAVLNAVKGHRGSRNRRYKVAKESLLHAMAYSTIHRRERKRDMRRLAIIRVNAAARQNGLSYGQLIHGLTLAQVDLDRRSLAELAVREPKAFAEVVSAARAALPA